MESKIEERNKGKNLSLLERFLSQKNNAYINNCFLAIDYELAYVANVGLGLGDWATLVDTKGYERRLNGNGFYEPVVIPTEINPDSSQKKAKSFLSWRKITNKEKIKKTQEAFDSIKMFFESSESTNYFSFDLKFELKDGGHVVDLYSIKESLFLIDQSVVRRCISCYFAKKEYYLDRDTFLFLRGLDFKSPANCWIPDNPEIPIKFTECHYKDSKTIAIMWVAKF